MATKAKGNTTQTKIKKTKVKRPGIHSKSKTSNLKSSKNYRKLYKGQGN
jgi:hypothetical protein